MAKRTSAPAIIVTCEHASSAVPRRYAGLFRTATGRAALRSHEGSDIGARPFARRLASFVGVDCHEGTVTRLLVDLNRSPRHPALFSRFSQSLPAADKEQLMDRYYFPFRNGVRRAIDEALRKHERVLHVSVHSFTPVLGGQLRRASVGLLYDPRRPNELATCRRWQQALQHALPDVKVRRNYPYRGAADGHTTTLRREYPPSRYAGVEVELNQALLLRGTVVDGVFEVLTAQLA